MRVLLVAVSAPAKMTGVHRHALNLAKSLLKRGDHVDMVIAPWQLSSTRDVGLTEIPHFTLHVADLKPGVIARNLWHCTSLPRLINDSGVDIVHLTYPVPVLKSLICRPVVVTLHDLYPIEIPGNFGRFKSIFNRGILHLCLRKADAITTVSDHTLTLLRKYMPHAAHKAVRIYNSIETCAAPSLHSPISDWSGYPFLLCVAQHRRNKNIPLLLHAFHRLVISGDLKAETRLVIVGVPGPETKAIKKIMRCLDISQRVVILNGLSEAELNWCYLNAMMLVAPSITEGFGFPVAEAMEAGCPCVCSDIPSFREIEPTHAIFFSLGPHAESNLADAILRAGSASPPPPTALHRFSAEAIGEQYAHLYFDLQLHHLSTTAGPVHG